MNKKIIFSVASERFNKIFKKLKNNKLYRLMDWGVGDPNRKKETYVRVIGAIANKETKVEFKGPSAPSTEKCAFYKVEDHYECLIIPEEPGFGNILSSNFGVNYEKEYEKIGYDEEAIKQLTKETGGSIFDEKDTKGILEMAQDKAKIEVLEKKFLDWYLIIAAMVMFLLEILIRRIKEKIKKR